MGFGSFLKSVGSGLKKVASTVNPIAGMGYDAVQGKGLKAIGKGFVGNSVNGMKASAAALPLALTGGAAGAAAAGGGGGMASLLGGGGVAGGLKALGGWALHNPDILLAGASAIGGLDSQRKADRFQNKAIQQVEQSYNERAPLRTQGIAQMLNQTPPDTSEDFRTSNPFASARQRGLRRI